MLKYFLFPQKDILPVDINRSFVVTFVVQIRTYRAKINAKIWYEIFIQYHHKSIKFGSIKLSRFCTFNCIHKLIIRNSSSPIITKVNVP